MWQNKIHSLWTSIQQTRPENKFCETRGFSEGTSETKYYSDLVKDLSILAAHFNSKTQLKIIVNMEKSYESFLLILFCLLKGHCFIPQPPKSKQNLVEILKPDWVVSQSDLKTILQSLASSQPDAFTPSKPAAAQTAYMISTSGTTGVPKLIPISFDNFSCYIGNIASLLKISSKIRLIQNFEISFDPYLFDLVSVILAKGSFLPVAHPDTRNFNSLFSQNSEVPSWTSLTPTQADLILSLNLNFSSTQLQKTFFLGEKLKRSLCDRWLKMFPSTKIYNLYGPAEITVSISFHEYDPLLDTENFIPVGNIHSDHTFIKNQNDELLIKGPQVFNGYLFADPTPNNEWFNTRDIVKIKDSKIYILGRSDLQVKINGRRFEPQELEIALEGHGINGYIVATHSEEEFKFKTTITFVTTDRSIVADKLRNCLISKFDSDFIPKSIKFINQYPLSQNGKIDRLALRQLINSISE